METLIGFIALFATVFGIMYLHFTTRNKERMALIEKGADASLFNLGKERKNLVQGSRLAFKTGVFLMGIGLGVIFGSICNSTGLLPEESAYFSMILLFGGLSLVIFHLADKKNK